MATHDEEAPLNGKTDKASGLRRPAAIAVVVGLGLAVVALCGAGRAAGPRSARKTVLASPAPGGAMAPCVDDSDCADGRECINTSLGICLADGQFVCSVFEKGKNGETHSACGAISCPAGTTPDYGANECKWNECTCDHGTPFTGKTIQQKYCGLSRDHNYCPPTQCDNKQHLCQVCDDGYYKLYADWVPVRLRVAEIYNDATEYRCKECDYDLMQDSEYLFDGLECTCVIQGNWCDNDDQCCGENKCKDNRCQHG